MESIEQLLSDALSANTEKRQLAEVAIHEHFTQSETFTITLMNYIATDAPNKPTKQLALIVLLRHVETYWKTLSSDIRMFTMNIAFQLFANPLTEKSGRQLLAGIFLFGLILIDDLISIII